MRTASVYEVLLVVRSCIHRTVYTIVPQEGHHKQKLSSYSCQKDPVSWNRFLLTGIWGQLLFMRSFLWYDRVHSTMYTRSYHKKDRINRSCPHIPVKRILFQVTRRSLTGRRTGGSSNWTPLYDSWAWNGVLDESGSYKDLYCWIQCILYSVRTTDCQVQRCTTWRTAWAEAVVK